MDEIKSSIDYLEDKDYEQDLPCVEPIQEGLAPKWEFRPRRNPKWGVVERQGLVVGRGANKKVVPPDEVYKLASFGCDLQEISDWFQISRETLKYNFQDYINKGRSELNQRLRRAMIQNACNNNNAAVQIFLAKNLLNMSDNGLTNGDGKEPLPWSEDAAE